MSDSRMGGIMSKTPLRLVHSYPFIGQTDDLALALMVSICGLLLNFAFLAIGIGEQLL